MKTVKKKSRERNYNKQRVIFLRGGKCDDVVMKNGLAHENHETRLIRENPTQAQYTHDIVPHHTARHNMAFLYYYCYAATAECRAVPECSARNIETLYQSHAR